MRRISRRYRIAFVAAVVLIVAGWGYAHYYRYEREQAIERYVYNAINANDKEMPRHSDPVKWDLSMRALIQFWAPREDPWTRYGFVTFLEEHPWRMALTTIVACIGFAYIAGTVRRLLQRLRAPIRRWYDGRATRRLLVQSERLRQSYESSKGLGP